VEKVEPAQRRPSPKAQRSRRVNGGLSGPSGPRPRPPFWLWSRRRRRRGHNHRLALRKPKTEVTPSVASQQRTSHHDRIRTSPTQRTKLPLCIAVAAKRSNPGQSFDSILYPRQMNYRQARSSSPCPIYQPRGYRNVCPALRSRGRRRDGCSGADWLARAHQTAHVTIDDAAVNTCVPRRGRPRACASEGPMKLRSHGIGYVSVAPLTGSRTCPDGPCSAPSAAPNAAP